MFCSSVTKEVAMAMVRCSECGSNRLIHVETCPVCGHRLNGAALPQGAASLQRSTPPELPSTKLSPELLEWARQQFHEEEFIAGLREIQDTGGLELKDFIQELEQEAATRD
jgi:hypothetical protein